MTLVRVGVAKSIKSAALLEPIYDRVHRMSDLECLACGKTKGLMSCELCQDSVCKQCVQFVSEDTFSYLPTLPEALSHRNYCTHCYDGEVAPALDTYYEVMERAKNVFVFFKTQRKEIPLIKRTREVHKIEKCVDRDITILKLAFIAAEQGFNGIIEVEANAKKLRNGAYQTSEWSGEGVCAMVDERKIHLQDARNEVYR